MGQKTAGAFLLRVLDQLPCRALFYHHAPIHEHDPVGHIPGKVHLVGNDDHRGLAVCQFAQHPQHLSGQLGVQRTGGLVKAEDIRVQCQRPGNGHPLLLSAGQLVRIVPRPRRQPHLLQQRPG